MSLFLQGPSLSDPIPLVLLTYAHLTNASTVILLSLLELQFLPPRPKGNVILVFPLACIALFELMLMFVGRQSQLTLPRPNYLLLTFPISTLICAALLPSLICGLFCPTSALSAARPRPGKQDHHHFNNLLGSRQNPPLHCKIAFGPTPCSHIFR